MRESASQGSLSRPPGSLERTIPPHPQPVHAQWSAGPWVRTLSVQVTQGGRGAFASWCGRPSSSCTGWSHLSPRPFSICNHFSLLNFSLTFPWLLTLSRVRVYSSLSWHCHSFQLSPFSASFFQGLSVLSASTPSPASSLPRGTFSCHRHQYLNYPNQWKLFTPI